MKATYLVIYEHPRPSECWCAVHDGHDSSIAAWRLYRETKTRIAVDGVGSVRIAKQLDEAGAP